MNTKEKIYIPIVIIAMIFSAIYLINSITTHIDKAGKCPQWKERLDQEKINIENDNSYNAFLLIDKIAAYNKDLNAYTRECL